MPHLHRLLFVLSLTLCASKAEPLRLDQAIGHALQHNRSLARAAVLLQASEQDHAIAASEFALRLIPDTRLGFGNNQEESGAGLILANKLRSGLDLSVGIDARRVATDFQRSYRTSARIECRTPLFRNSGRLIHEEGLQQARNRQRSARRAWYQQASELVLEVVALFEEILRLEQQLDADQRLFERSGNLLRITRAREARGRSSRIDTLRVSLQRGEAEARLVTNRERLATARQDFRELLGRDTETPQLAPPPRLDMDLPELHEALAIALANRLDLADALQQLDDRRRAVLIAERSHLPDLELITRYERFGEDPSFADANGFGEDQWFVGISGNTDLLQRTDRERLRQARLNHRAETQTIDITRRLITREVQRALSACRRTRLNHNVAQRNLERAQQAATLAQRLYQAGRSDNFSVTDAEESRSEAEARLRQAQADEIIADYRLKHVLGTLVEPPPELKPFAAP